jgi:methylamine--corrinoid protein Co-methyltransferase
MAITTESGDRRERLIEILARVENGPLMEEKDFERGIVAPTAQRLTTEHGIRRRDGVIVPGDDDLADRLYLAGLEFAVEVGVFCTDTSRRIMWTANEYEDTLRRSPGSAIFGSGTDAVEAHARTPEDETPLMVVGGPYGIEISEDLFVPLMSSYAREKLIDVIDNPTLERVYGHPPKAGSPWEVVGGWREAQLSMEVVDRAGRPGMCIAGVELSPTALGEISASSWGGFRPTDLHHAAGISEFKTNYESLSKVAHLTHIDALTYAFMACIYGGYLGGPEGIALGLTAAGIVLNQNYLPIIVSLSSVHPFLQCTTTPELIWAFSAASQALSRNTELLFSSLVRPSAGPGTKTMLYENAAFSLATTVSGQSFIQASMSASGTRAGHASGLDAKISAEVSHAARGMSRKQADHIALELYRRYESDLEHRLVGKPFEEVYDVETIRPTPEWEDLYGQVKLELRDLGLSIP